ncbi:hypothetical protein AAG570_004533 [Ranatra chinensis]|uniref:Hexosyltransferase n=1 Tax=Ranatra chinensis TaxID=642074 RepID=A0ABD0Y161_9HEMI
MGPPAPASPAPHVTHPPVIPLAGSVSNSSAPYSFDKLPPDDPFLLIDLKGFSFLKAPVCQQSNWSTLPVVAIVHSAPSNHYNRRQIRRTWGRDVPVVFTLGSLDETTDEGRRLAASVDLESRRHGDIVQGTFLDSYRNLTYKHVMGLKWATYLCPNARYILKTDDDVFVNTKYLFELLQSDWVAPGGSYRRGLLLCNVMPTAMVKRTYRSKWRVSPKEYPGRWYPQYCVGWVVLYSLDVAFTLYKLAQTSSYFWIDDVHITGTLVSKTDIQLSHLGPLSTDSVSPPSSLSVPQTDHQFLFALTTPDYFPGLQDLVNPHHSQQEYYWYQSPSSHLTSATTTSR